MNKIVSQTKSRTDLVVIPEWKSTYMQSGHL